MTKSSWLKLDAYVVYEQVFVWASHSMTEYMTWNVTGLSGDFADFHLVSHGVANVTGENIDITIGEVN